MACGSYFPDCELDPVAPAVETQRSWPVDHRSPVTVFKESKGMVMLQDVMAQGEGED